MTIYSTEVSEESVTSNVPVDVNLITVQPPAGAGNVDLHPCGVTLNEGPTGPGALNITIPDPPAPPP